MEEKENGIIHIFFIFIGIALICLGTFYFFTDKKIDNSNTSSNNEKEKEEENKNKNNNQDFIKQIVLMNDIETPITLVNNNEVKIEYKSTEDPSQKIFYYNGEKAFETKNIFEVCDQFYLYNNSIVAYCHYSLRPTGYLNIIDANGNVKKIDSFKYNNYEMMIGELSLSDNKLMVNGIIKNDDSIITINNEKIYFCNDDGSNKINKYLDIEYSNDYELKINNDNLEFIFVKNNKKIKDYIEENCKTVE